MSLKKPRKFLLKFAGASDSFGIMLSKPLLEPKVSSRGFLLPCFFVVRSVSGGFMKKKELKESKTTQEDIEKAKIQIEENEYLNHICEQHESCVLYDEYSNDEEGYVQKFSKK